MVNKSWTRPLPTVSGETRPFWAACLQGRLLLQYCNACGKYQFYPRGFCSHCWTQKDLTWVQSTGKGKIWSFTVTYQNRSPGFVNEVPYILALVELEGGVKMFTNIVECELVEVQIGLPVEVVFYRATADITVPFFRPNRRTPPRNSRNLST